MKTINTWNWSHSKDGFFIEINKASYWGTLLSDIVGLFDMDWWGKYKNLPFCWINPWGWTWKMGTEDHNLGSLWWNCGQWICNFQYKIQNEKLVNRIPMSDEEVKAKWPDAWDWAHYWDEEDDE